MAADPVQGWRAEGQLADLRGQLAAAQAAIGQVIELCESAADGPGELSTAELAGRVLDCVREWRG
jgi:hypothetical protein